MNRTEYRNGGAQITAPRGDQLPHTRLTVNDVRWIRANPKGMTRKAMADLLGVHWRTVDKVCNYESWRHV